MPKGLKNRSAQCQQEEESGVCSSEELNALTKNSVCVTLQEEDLWVGSVQKGSACVVEQKKKTIRVSDQEEERSVCRIDLKLTSERG